MRNSIAILGGGPIGLEAALYARTLGLDAVVYEAGHLADHVRGWSHVRLFTPWTLNASGLGATRLEETGAWDPAPPSDRCPTGSELVADYLTPLSLLPEMKDVVHESHRVLALGRGELLKGEAIGDPLRSKRPFRILLDTPRGERIAEADTVIDATGVLGQPNRLGKGGVPALGERAVRSRLTTGFPDIPGKDRGTFEGKRVLVVGAGMTAATSIVALSRLEDARVVWATRGGAPVAEIENDSLKERRTLTREANALADSRAVRHLPGCAVTRLALADDGVRVTLENPEGETVVEADRVLVHTGFRPDTALFRELQVHQCYASEGPMKLAASLLGAAGGDCMDQVGFGPDSLQNPEPGFFIVGMKSYGRGSSFLLRIGHEQVRDVFRLIMNDSELDLYRGKPSGVS